MVVTIEGVSASGKTSWCLAHYPNQTVPEAPVADDAPDRAISPVDAATFWLEVHCRRWADALEMEGTRGTAVCDSDPFKLHYAWGLWRIGELPSRAWKDEVELTREAFVAERLGLSDLVIVADVDRAELARRRKADETRRRRNFELHVRLVDPLRAWYRTVDSLDLGRVLWGLPAQGLDEVSLPERRRDRSDVKQFDQLIRQLDSF